MLKFKHSPPPPLLSLPDIIANELRRGIVSGHFNPGEALRQEEIASQFSTSRIPVREALRRLQAEGLVELHSHKGAVVAILSPDDIRELFEIRILLEPTALVHAIPKQSVETWQRAQALVDAIDIDGGQNPLSDINREFHMTLYAPANRPILLDMIQGLYRKTDRYGQRLPGLEAQHLKAQNEHRQILQACEQANTELAATLLTEHIKQFGEELATIFQSDRGLL